MNDVEAYGVLVAKLREQIEARDEELAKCDRRSAEQERIIVKQREMIAELRDALKEAIDGWERGELYAFHDSTDKVFDPDPRIAELRKLAEPHEVNPQITLEDHRAQWMPTCARCERRVDRLMLEHSAILGTQIYIAQCHGETENLFIREDSLVLMRNPAQEVRATVKNWRPFSLSNKPL